MATVARIIPTESNPEALINFQEYVDGHLTSGIDGHGNKKGYITFEDLQRYWTREKLEQLFLSFSPPTVVSSAEVIRRFLRTLSVLVYTGKAGYITWFFSHDQDDARLPHESQPYSLPDAQELYPTFKSNQWRFCPYYFSPAPFMKPLDADCILAVTIEENLSPPTADRSRPVIQKVKLKNVQNNSNEGKTVVFKTYHGVESSHLWETEVKTFQAIFQSGHCEHIVRCLGSFQQIQSNKYTIILEYADGGTLLDLLQNDRTFLKYQDRVQLWERLFDLLTGLQRIHGLQPDTGSNNLMTLKCIHLDIKPANILVFKGPTNGPHNCRFKLADFGSSPIRVALTGQALSAEDTGGTPMYSAPECCRDFRSLANEPLRVTPEADIWSLGCVFSETLVWTIMGEHGREVYERRRAEATRTVPRIADAGYGGCFHNIDSRLTIVDVMHKEANNYCSYGDKITPRVSSIILRYMLRPNTDGRLPPRNLLRVFKDAVEETSGSHGGPKPPIEPLLEPPPTAQGKLQGQSSMWRGPLSTTHPAPLAISSSPLDSKRPSDIHGPAKRPSILPMVTVDEVNDCRDGTRRFTVSGLFSGRRPVEELEGIKYLQQLRGRDEYFIIDDSASMRKYKQDVIATFQALAWLVKRVDDDGIDLFFTSEPNKPHHDKRSGPLVRKILERKMYGICMMNLSLDAMANIIIHKNIPLRRPVSVYVLTNGDWGLQGETVGKVDEIVERIVREMEKKNVADSFVALQFIRFGDLADGIKRLKKLDKLGEPSKKNPEKKVLRKDIVNHTASNGSVWKMLIGGLVPDVDNESDDDDDDDDDNWSDIQSHNTYFNYLDRGLVGAKLLVAESQETPATGARQSDGPERDVSTQAIPANQPTDSGYASAPTTSLKGKEISQITERDHAFGIPEDEGMPDTGSVDGRTEFSSASSEHAQLTKQHVIFEMALELIRVPARDLDSNMERLALVLPDMLQTFALIISHCAPTRVHQEIMYLVRKYRHEIVRRFQENYAQSDHDGDGNIDSPRPTLGHDPPMTRDDIIARFQGALEPPTVEDMAEASEGTTNRVEDQGQDDSDEDQDDAKPEIRSTMDTYRDCIVESPAYKWLLGALLREISLVPAAPDVRSKIRKFILDSLPIPRKVSRAMPVPPHQAVFEVAWDPLLFIRKQEYRETAGDAICMAITLTGSAQDAQAMPTAKYLSQTWPLTGSHVMGIIRCVFQAEPGDKQYAILPGKTKLEAWTRGPKLIVSVFGSQPLVAEIGEQLAWLGAALRPSPLEKGVSYCTPYIKRGHKSDSTSGDSQEKGPVFEILFGFEHVRDGAANGQCWHDMFKNPVVVRGYPIAKREVAQTGLEMPLNMMARMIRTSHAVPFNSTWYLKGYSSMLTLSERKGDMLLWHHAFDPDGGRVSYFQDKATANCITPVTASELENARHVVGWCSDVKLFAGAYEDVNYDIAESKLSGPHATCVLDRLSVSGGKIISGGVSIAIGVRETPIHLSRDTYRDKMRWVSGQYAILWDEESNRGWLVNGASALLHIVLASLEDDVRWMRKLEHSHILFKKEDLVGPATSHTSESALNVLMNGTNKELKLFVNDIDEWDARGEDDAQETKSKTTYTRFKHLVEKHYSLLEQIMDHQFHIEDPSGLNLKMRIRKHLEGWDFRDLAITIKTRPVYPRLKTLKTIAHGWVDFTREIKAITIFGRGFGEIIRPTDAQSMCGSCSQVPSGMYYLAACVSDLKAIMGLKDDEHHLATPIRICDGLNWIPVDNIFRQCQCVEGTASKARHSDIAQVLAPSRTFLRTAPKSGIVELNGTGAVVFGYNRRFKIRWPDEGNPEEGDIPVDSPSEMSDFVDSAIGMSPATTRAATNNSGERQLITQLDRTSAPPSLVSVSDVVPGPSATPESSRQSDLSFLSHSDVPGEPTAHEAEARSEALVEQSTALPLPSDEHHALPIGYQDALQNNAPRSKIRTRMGPWLTRARAAGRSRLRARFGIKRG